MSSSSSDAPPPPPPLGLTASSSAAEVRSELDRCRASVRRLEREVSKERFRMIYLQTLLAKERKSYDTRRWGFGHQDDRRRPEGAAGGSSSLYVDLEYDRGKGLVKVKDRAVSDRLSSLGGLAVKMDADRRRPYDDPDLNPRFLKDNLLTDGPLDVWTRPEEDDGGYTPDCSSNDNLTSSEEEMSPSGQLSPDTSAGAAALAGRSLDSERSLDGGSPTTTSQKRRQACLAGTASGSEAEDHRRPQETLPFIDASPSSSPQRRGSSGEQESSETGDPELRRRWVLSGILASEETYLSHLEALLLPLKPLRAASLTSQPVLSGQQIEAIFFQIPEIFRIHRDFHEGLRTRLREWGPRQRVADLFHTLAGRLGVYRAFLDNYQVAMETAEKCCQANPQFAEISENLIVRSGKDSKDQTTTKYSLETLLYKPVDRVTRSTLVLHDLLKQTPASHPDFLLLQDALRISQNFLSGINQEIAPRTPSRALHKGQHRQLVKDGFLVEMVEGSRKLRHVFLFSDLFLCAKLKKPIAGRRCEGYECKWYVPLPEASFQALEDGAEDGGPAGPDPEALKVKISRLRSLLRREKKGSRSGERLKKKLCEQESLLLLLSPNIAFRMGNPQGKSSTFLVSSDYERAEWREALREQQRKCPKSFSSLTPVELQTLTNSCLKLQTVHRIPLTVNKEDDESPGLYGFLNVIVHSASGFRQSSNLYCTLEVDSFGYFVNKAKTRVYRDTTEPNWNEEFEIELEGSQTLRILCYGKCYNKTKTPKEDGETADRIMGKGQIQLDPQTLQEKDWHRTVVSMNGVEAKLSLKFTSREFSLKRMPSRKPTGVFGVKIAAVTKRERSKIPYVVRQCVEEVERRGMEEVGIYRVSGVATDVQALKAAFDANDKDVSVMMSEMDVNAIAGTLKLYFRELPEPLFTDELYPNFAEGIALSDPVAKESCMLNLLLSLPEPNLVTFLFLLDHLKRVAEKENVNKMSLHNLATVFGPTLLRPSQKDTKIPANPTQPIAMTDSWSLEVMSQVQVLLYFLQLETIPTPDSKRQSILFSTEV